MIHIAIFDITKEGQSYVQGLCDFSDGFPAALKAPIEQVCYRFGDAGRSMQISREPALRFSVLGEEQYLLSVICRIPADPQQGIPRSYSRIANYVLDEGAADGLLAVGNWKTAADKLLALSKNPAQLQGQILAKGWEAVFGEVVGNSVRLEGELALAVVLGGCLETPEKKVRIVQDEPGEDYLALEWLMKRLPPILRRNVRFITNVTSPGEETGICLSFCTSRAADSMEQRGNQGGELANICTCRSGRLMNYKVLQEDLQTAQTILTSSGDSLYFAKLFLKEARYETYLTLLQNDWKSPEETLKMLCQVCGEKMAISFLKHCDHGYAPNSMMALLKAKPKWLKAYQDLNGYLRQQYGSPRKKVVIQGVHVSAPPPKVTIIQETVPSKLKEEVPAPKKKRSGSLFVILAILAAAALLGIILVFVGAFDFIAADSTIVLTVAAQEYIIRMLGAVLFTVIFTVCVGILVLLAVRKNHKNK